MNLYGLKNCDTCRKAIKMLEADGKNANFIDIRASGLTKAQITKWEKMIGWETLLNTRSTTWRGLKDSDKANLDAKKAIALMTEHPTLIKRPVIEIKSAIHVGWTKNIQDQFLS